MNSETVKYIYEGYLTYMGVSDNGDERRISLRNLFARMRTIITYYDMALQSTATRITDLRAQADAIEAQLRLSVSTPIVRSQARSDTSTVGFNFDGEASPEGETSPTSPDVEVSPVTPATPVVQATHNEPTAAALETNNCIETMDESITPRDQSLSIVYSQQEYVLDNSEIYDAVTEKLMLDQQYKDARIASDLADSSLREAYRRQCAALVDSRRNVDSYLKNALNRDLCSAMYRCVNCFTALTNDELDAKAADMYYDETGADHGYCSMCEMCQREDTQSNGSDM